MQALKNGTSGESVKGALAESISSASGVDADAVEVTKVAESVEGALDFDFGDAAALVATAYEDPSARVEIDLTLRTAVAGGLANVTPSDVEILGIMSRNRILGGLCHALARGSPKETIL